MNKDMIATKDKKADGRSTVTGFPVCTAVSSTSFLYNGFVFATIEVGKAEDIIDEMTVYDEPVPRPGGFVSDRLIMISVSNSTSIRWTSVQPYLSLGPSLKICYPDVNGRIFVLFGFDPQQSLTFDLMTAHRIEQGFQPGKGSRFVLTPFQTYQDHSSSPFPLLKKAQLEVGRRDDRGQAYLFLTQQLGFQFSDDPVYGNQSLGAPGIQLPSLQTKIGRPGVPVWWSNNNYTNDQGYVYYTVRMPARVGDLFDVDYQYIDFMGTEQSIDFAGLGPLPADSLHPREIPVTDAGSLTTPKHRSSGAAKNDDYYMVTEDEAFDNNDYVAGDIYRANFTGDIEDKPYPVRSKNDGAENVWTFVQPNGPGTRKNPKIWGGVEAIKGDVFKVVAADVTANPRLAEGTLYKALLDDADTDDKIRDYPEDGFTNDVWATLSSTEDVNHVASNPLAYEGDIYMVTVDEALQRINWRAGDLYEAKFSDYVQSRSFPTSGQSNKDWKYVGENGEGTFSNPKDRLKIRHRSLKGDIFCVSPADSSSNRELITGSFYKALFMEIGYNDPLPPYPPYGQNNNDWGFIASMEDPNHRQSNPKAVAGAVYMVTEEEVALFPGHGLVAGGLYRARVNDDDIDIDTKIFPNRTVNDNPYWEYAGSGGPGTVSNPKTITQAQRGLYGDVFVVTSKEENSGSDLVAGDRYKLLANSFATSELKPFPPAGTSRRRQQGSGNPDDEQGWWAWLGTIDNPKHRTAFLQTTVGTEFVGDAVAGDIFMVTENEAVLSGLKAGALYQYVARDDEHAGDPANFPKYTEQKYWSSVAENGPGTFAKPKIADEHRAVAFEGDIFRKKSSGATDYFRMVKPHSIYHGVLPERFETDSPQDPTWEWTWRLKREEPTYHYPRHRGIPGAALPGDYYMVTEDDAETPEKETILNPLTAGDIYQALRPGVQSFDFPKGRFDDENWAYKSFSWYTLGTFKSPKHWESFAGEISHPALRGDIFLVTSHDVNADNQLVANDYYKFTGPIGDNFTPAGSYQSKWEKAHFGVEGALENTKDTPYAYKGSLFEIMDWDVSNDPTGRLVEGDVYEAQFTGSIKYKPFVTNGSTTPYWKKTTIHGTGHVRNPKHRTDSYGNAEKAVTGEYFEVTSHEAALSNGRLIYGDLYEALQDMNPVSPEYEFPSRSEASNAYWKLIDSWRAITAASFTFRGLVPSFNPQLQIYANGNQQAALTLRVKSTNGKTEDAVSMDISSEQFFKRSFTTNPSNGEVTDSAPIYFELLDWQTGIPITYLPTTKTGNGDYVIAEPKPNEWGWTVNQSSEFVVNDTGRTLSPYVPIPNEFRFFLIAGANIDSQVQKTLGFRIKPSAYSDNNDDSHWWINWSTPSSNGNRQDTVTFYTSRRQISIDEFQPLVSLRARLNGWDPNDTTGAYPWSDVYDGVANWIPSINYLWRQIDFYFSWAGNGEDASIIQKIIVKRNNEVVEDHSVNYCSRTTNGFRTDAYVWSGKRNYDTVKILQASENKYAYGGKDQYIDFNRAKLPGLYITYMIYPSTGPASYYSATDKLSVDVYDILGNVTTFYPALDLSYSFQELKDTNTYINNKRLILTDKIPDSNEYRTNSSETSLVNVNGRGSMRTKNLTIDGKNYNYLVTSKYGYRYVELNIDNSKPLYFSILYEGVALGMPNLPYRYSFLPAWDEAAFYIFTDKKSLGDSSSPLTAFIYDAGEEEDGDWRLVYTVDKLLYGRHKWRMSSSPVPPDGSKNPQTVQSDEDPVTSDSSDDLSPP